LGKHEICGVILVETVTYHGNEKVKLSVCLTKHHAMKTYGEWSVATRILNLGTSWRYYHGNTETTEICELSCKSVSDEVPVHRTWKQKKC